MPVMSSLSWRQHAETETIVWIANTGPQEAELTLSEGDSVRVAAGTWSRCRLTSKSGDVTLETSADQLFITRPVELRFARKKQPHILLISADTLRADRFNARHMPRMTRYFSRGTTFTQARSVAPWTLPAHASLFTSLPPALHGVRTPDQKLPRALPSLASALSAAGYITTAITEGNYLSASYGLNTGFHSYFEFPPDMMVSDPEQGSKLVPNLHRLRSEIQSYGDAPLFVFFHTFEVHCPYFPRGGLEDPEGLGLTANLLEMDGKQLDPEILDKIAALYDGEVNYLDQVLGEWLEMNVNPEDWLVVFLSDHGEEFGEHGGLLHADTLFDEVLRIALAMTGPGVARELRDQICSIGDVAPTILDYLGIPAPVAWTGKSLLGDLPAETPHFSETFFLGPHIPAQDPCLLSVTLSPHKMISNTNFGETHIQVFDLGHDAAEYHPLEPHAYPSLETLILRYGQVTPLDNVPAAQLTPEHIENLRGLGYVQ